METQHIRGIINAAYGAYCEAWAANDLQKVVDSAILKDKLFNDTLFTLQKKYIANKFGGKK